MSYRKVGHRADLQGNSGPRLASRSRERCCIAPQVDAHGPVAQVQRKPLCADGIPPAPCQNAFPISVKQERFDSLAGLNAPLYPAPLKVVKSVRITISNGSG